MLYQILRPFSYLKIKNAGHKVVYDLVMPLALTLTAGFLVLLGHQWDIAASLKDNKIPDTIFDIVKNLPGFYIAALAAIATFSKESLDETIKNQLGDSPFIKVREVDHNGRETNIDTKLSRRVFLTFLFAFLTAVSFLILCTYLILSASGLFNTSVLFVSIIINFAFLFLFWQLIVCTFFGLYYLADKLHH